MEENSIVESRRVRDDKGHLLPREQIQNAAMTVWLDKKPSIDKRFPARAVQEVIYMCKGVWSDVCYSLDCSSRQLSLWLERHPQYKEDFVKAKVSLVEQAEETVISLLHSQNEKVRLDAARLVLTKLGRDSGWADSPSFTAVNVNVNPDDKVAQIKAIFGIPLAHVGKKDEHEVIDAEAATVNQDDTSLSASDAGGH